MAVKRGLVCDLRSRPYKLLGAPLLNSSASDVSDETGDSSLNMPTDISAQPPHVSAFFRQQCLYFLPLPQGQGALRTIPLRCRGIAGRSAPVSW